MQRIWIIAVLVIIGLSWAGISPAFDFNGDGADDVAIFRPASGLWAVRGVTRAYFGGWNDEPAAGDYNGDGIDEIAIFRGSSGLWAVRNWSRIYYGSAGDLPVGGSDGDWYRSGDNLCALAAGNIGIGTGTPQFKVHIVGNNPRILIEDNGTSNPEINFRASHLTYWQDWSIYKDAASGDFRFYYGGDRMVIQPEGNVGIGTTSPMYPLEVNGAVMLDGLSSDPTAGSWTAGIFARSGTTTELFAIDGANNKTQISPHDPETGKWIFYSENERTGRVLRIEMEELIFDLAEEMSKKTGKQYIFDQTE